MFNETEAKSIKITAEITLADEECDKQKVPRGTVQRVVWVDHSTSPVEIEWSPGTERGWVRWAPLPADGQVSTLPTIP